jgi:Methylamine utilisation protein MauE
MDPVIDATVRTTLALLLLAAAAHKLREPARFRATVADYRLLPRSLVTIGAAILVLSELAVAIALAGARAWGLAGAAALLGLYAAAIAVNLARGRRHLDCGCTGPALRRPISGWLVLRNLALVAIALADLSPLATRPLVWIDHLTIVAATAAFAACWMAADQLLATAPGLARLREAA